VEPKTLDEATALVYAAQAAVASTGEILGRLLESMAGVEKSPLAPGELADAKTAASSAYLTRIETRAGLASEIGRVKSSHLPADYIETYTARLNAVTEEQVRAIAEKYLSTKDAVIVIEGDAAKIQPEVSSIGTFEVIRQK
jgi:predicted Zn-dependent peptidase